MCTVFLKVGTLDGKPFPSMFCLYYVDQSIRWPSVNLITGDNTLIAYRYAADIHHLYSGLFL